MKTVFILLFIFYYVNSFEVNKNKLRIFLIEINPILESIQNKDVYKSNDGHPSVSEFFDHNKERALEEIIEDLEFGSHGKIKIDIVNHVILNEFPKYKNKISLIDGRLDYRYDEATYVAKSVSENCNYLGRWYRMFVNNLYDAPGSYNFDYEYIIQKYNLVNLRNNNKFDHVWILGIDPLSTYETIMVGSDAFWINGEPINKECKNFMIAAFTISRRDANLHALAHSFENILHLVFNRGKMDYHKQYNDYTQKDYENLNYWEKFTLIDKYSRSHNAGVGNIHYPFNGYSDYDYSNDTKVYSNWESWLNYPNLNGTKKKSNNKAWMDFPGNIKIIKDTLQNLHPDRLYVRFWMYLLPHIDGYTEDGFLNNWWDYYTNLDYVSDMLACHMKVSGFVGEELFLEYRVYYRSEEAGLIEYVKEDKNVKINGNCVKVQNNKLIGAQKG